MAGTLAKAEEPLGRGWGWRGSARSPGRPRTPWESQHWGLVTPEERPLCPGRSPKHLALAVPGREVQPHHDSARLAHGPPCGCPASPRALRPTPSGPGVSHRVPVRARGQGAWARGVAQCDAPTRPGGLARKHPCPPRVAVLRCAPSFLTPVLVSPSADRPTSSSQHRHPQTACGLPGPRDPELCCQRHEAWLGEGVAVARAGDCRALRNLLCQLRGCEVRKLRPRGDSSKVT